MGAGGTRSGFFQSYSEPHLWLSVSFSSGVIGVDVEQSPAALTAQEGASSTLWCNFSTSSDSVQWYLQKPGGRLIHLIYIPSGTRQEGRLNVTAVPKERRSSLHISSLRTTDSGTSVLCSTVLPGHLQPVLKPSAGLSPSCSHSHTVRPPQGICSASYWPYRFETLVFIFLSICIFF